MNMSESFLQLYTWIVTMALIALIKSKCLKLNINNLIIIYSHVEIIGRGGDILPYILLFPKRLKAHGLKTEDFY